MVITLNISGVNGLNIHTRKVARVHKTYFIEHCINKVLLAVAGVKHPKNLPTHKC